MLEIKAGLIILSILNIIAIIYARWLFREVEKVKQDAEVLQASALQIQANTKETAKRSAEVKIRVLTKHIETLGLVITDLSSQLDTVEDDVDYNEIMYAIERNSDAIQKTQDNIDQLERWYFLNYGRHYLGDIEMAHFQDLGKNISMN